MPVTRLVASLLLAACFGVLLSKIISLDVDARETHSTTLTLCDSGGRRPCP